MSDPETLRIYAEKAGDYADLVKAGGVDPRLADFVATLPQGAHVLDLGCGPGQEAAAMARAGLRVSAWDATPEMVAMAAQHPGVDARCARFADLDGQDVYDGIWANFSLLHAPRADMPGHLAALARALRPGGCFHIALKTGTGSERDRLGRFYTYYTLAELTPLLADVGLAVTSTAMGRGKGLSGEDDDWFSVLGHG